MRILTKTTTTKAAAVAVAVVKKDFVVASAGMSP
jgi:hypothetical protein